ncbi:hypothetical protein EJ06DRAFT_328534 [Trichodelitschia bisporula]|uniref:Transcriptional regulator n=1 Tax=Trichodelitschia bisporula TaxID=703511 RepID=A0A6G1I1J5_9PEZI|nr:hypothetical protein EJ06DRAFT_328534 [Trichodelitschia bisporula]
MAPLSKVAIEEGLRDAVNAIFGTGKVENLTVRRVRLKAEEDLGLDAGFLKAGEWKDRSRDIILAAVEKLGDKEKASSAEPSPAPEDTPVSPPKPAPVKRATNKKGMAKVVKARVPSPVPSNPDHDIESEAERLEASDKKPKQRKRMSKAREPSPVPSDPDADIASEAERLEASDLKPKQRKRSSIKDSPEASRKKTKRISDDLPETPQKKGKKAKGRSEPEPLTKSQEKIKELQGQLTKCGVRKVWGVLMKKFLTDEEKIAYLRQMLRGVGMVGNFTLEKAKRIKEKRELESELEDVQSFAKVWGEDPNEESRLAAKRKAAQKEMDELLAGNNDLDSD